MGIDPERDKAVRDYELEQGRFFQKRHDALLEAGFAHGLGVKVGDQVKLTTSRGVKPFTVCGLLSPHGVAGFKQGNVIFVPLRTAQILFGNAGEVNIISVVLEDGVDEKTATEAIRSQLPQGGAADGDTAFLTVRSPIERSQLSKEMIEKVRAGLDLAYVTIIALAFVTILNTFLMNVGERRRQLAVLRAIGTTRRQLIHMLLVEGLAMGMVGYAAGHGGGARRRVSVDAIDGQSVQRPHARLADHAGPLHHRRTARPDRFAAGDVHPGLDRRPSVSVGRDEIRGLRPPRPHPALVCRHCIGRLPDYGCGGGRLHPRLSAF